MTPVERDQLRIKRLKEFDRAVVDTKIKCGETQTFDFTYQGDPANIQGHKIGCRTCTTVKREDNVFKVTFKAPPLSDYATNIARGEKEQQYTSNVTVYFNDGEGTQTFGTNGELTDNPDKVPVNLQIRATIEFV